MFNDLFKQTWQRQKLEQQECDIKRKFIEDNQKTFAFSFEVRTWFTNQTTNGAKSNKESSDTLQFTKAFNGRDGLIVLNMIA